MHRLHIRPLYQAEQGVISIMTTLVLILVISLIVLGFAQVSRRNQSEALDRQLSTQAFYAAESGVNDARNLISAAVASGTTVPDKTSCGGTGPAGFYSSLAPTLDATTNTKYSCLLVDASPDLLRYNSVGSTSVIVPVIPEGGTAVSKIKLTWNPKTTVNVLSGCPATAVKVFSQSSSWTCGYGVLRFDLVPTSGSVNAATLQANTMTTFAVPLSSGGGNTISYAAGAGNGNVDYGTSCTASECTLTIQGLTQNNYHMRISSLYRTVALQVEAFDSLGNKLGLTQAQALIDSTGKARDVLRRVQVNVPLLAASKNNLSDYALQTTDAICKRFAAMDNYFDSSVNGVTSTNRLCQP